MRRTPCGLAAATLVAVLAAGCPAHYVSRIASHSGREFVAVVPEEEKAKLRCDGEACASVNVTRDYSVSNSLPAYLAFLGLESAGLALSIDRFSKGIVERNRTGEKGSERELAYLGAILVLGVTTTLDVISGAMTAASGNFSRKTGHYVVQSRYVSAGFGGASFPVTLDDLLPPGQTRMPDSFSVEKAVRLRNLPYSTTATYQLKPGTRLVVIDFQPGDTGLAPEQRSGLSQAMRVAVHQRRPQIDVVSAERFLEAAAAVAKDGEDCDLQCAIRTARTAAGAGLVVTGEMVRFDKRLQLVLRLVETESGSVFKSVQLLGADPSELMQRLPDAAEQMVGDL